MLTGRSMQACLCREVPTDHEAHGQRSNGCRRARAQLQSSAQESRRLSFGGMYTRRPKQNSRNTVVFVLRLATRARERRACETRARELQRHSLTFMCSARRRRIVVLVSPADHAQHAKERPQDDMGEQFATKQFMECYDKRHAGRDGQTRPQQRRRALARSQQTQRRMIQETRSQKMGPTVGERADLQLAKRAVPTAGKEEHSQQQATSTKRAGGEDAGVRSRRWCLRQRLKVHQLQLIDKTLRIPVQAQRQLPTIHKITKTVEIPQAQSVLHRGV